MGEAEQFSFKGANGDTVYGWLTKPAGFQAGQAGQKYPLAFVIHGGPQGSSINEFHYRWNAALFASKGYVAALVNFHGSTGYGQAFTDAIRMDWGGKPLVDLQKGLEAAVEALEPGGRVAVLTYHSLEDRLVKRYFADEVGGCTCPPDFPVCTCGAEARIRILTRKPVRPRPTEIEDNPRASAAKLRAAERVATSEEVAS